MPVLKKTTRYQHRSFHACMGSLQNARKKIDAAGTKFLFVLYPGFMSVDLIPSVSHQPLWQCGLVGRWGRKHEFDTAGIDRFKHDFSLSFFAYFQSLFNYEEVFLFKLRPNASVLCVQCSTMPAVWTHPQWWKPSHSEKGFSGVGSVCFNFATSYLSWSRIR